MYVCHGCWSEGGPGVRDTKIRNKRIQVELSPTINAGGVLEPALHYVMTDVFLCNGSLSPVMILFLGGS